jgi:hypothetical protein
MIILLISTIWLATVVLFVTVCRMAAYGDRAAPARRQQGRSPRLLDDVQVPGLMRLEDRRRRRLRLEDRRLRLSRVRSEPSTAEHVGHSS